MEGANPVQMARDVALGMLAIIAYCYWYSFVDYRELVFLNARGEMGLTGKLELQ